MITGIGMAETRVKIALIFIITGLLLPAAGCVIDDRAPAPTEAPVPAPNGTFPATTSAITGYWTRSAVSGNVMNDIGQPVVNAKVTLWLDGKVVEAPGNPGLTNTGWNSSEFRPNDAGTFVFEVKPDRDYRITCEKDGYYGETTWDPANPIPARIIIRNPTGNTNDTKSEYCNVTDAQVEEAKAFAFSNETVRQFLDGLNYSIEYVTTASDQIDPLVMQISVLLGSYQNREGDIEITSRLLVCVDLSNKRIVTIWHNYGGSGTGLGFHMEIPPGGHQYSKVIVDDVNGHDRDHNLTWRLSGLSGLIVKPVALDAANFQRFVDGKPYDILLYGNESVSSDWSASTTIASNREYYFVVINEAADRTIKIGSNIDLTV